MAFILRTPGKFPKEHRLHSEHGESLKITNQKTVCEVLLNALDNDDLNHVLMTDEANFHFVAVSVRKTLITGQPRTLAIIFTRNLYILRRLFFGFGVASFGPYFFEDEAGRSVTVNSACYTEMLSTFLDLELQRLGVETQTLVSARQGNGSH